jgi:bifunctional DNase/RNase
MRRQPGKVSPDSIGASRSLFREKGVAMIEMVVHGVSTDSKAQRQVLWLRGLEDDVVMPIAIGEAEAMSIHAELAAESFPRPLTHDLVKTILDRFEAEVQQVRIVDLEGGTFFAELVVTSQGKELKLDARPSDGVALALKCGAPVYLSEEVLSQAGFVIRETGPEGVLHVEPIGEQEDRKAPDEGMVSAIDDLFEAAGVAEPGGSPGKGEEDPEQRRRDLERQLREAVAQERYEDAERIRKELERTKKKRGGD